MIVYRETSDIRKGDQIVMNATGDQWFLSVTEIVASEVDITYIGDSIPVMNRGEQVVVSVRPCDRVPVLVFSEAAGTKQFKGAGS